MTDKINPDHYKGGGIECIDFLLESFNEDQIVGFLLGNWIKYKWRSEKKGKEEDHKKAEWYMAMYMHVKQPKGYPDPRDQRREQSPVDVLADALKRQVEARYGISDAMYGSTIDSGSDE